MAVALWRILAGLLFAMSAFGFLNGLFFRIHGPAFDLGIIAGLLGAGALYVAKRLRAD